MHLRRFDFKGGMILRRSIFFPGVLVILTFLLQSCEKPAEEWNIDLPATSVLKVKSSWGLITSSHLRLREAPDPIARAVTTLWRGYVLEIQARDSELSEVEGRRDYWYRISYDGLQGWVFGGYLRLFDTRDQAERASRELE